MNRANDRGRLLRPGGSPAKRHQSDPAEQAGQAKVLGRRRQSRKQSAQNQPPWLVQAGPANHCEDHQELEQCPSHVGIGQGAPDREDGNSQQDCGRQDSAGLTQFRTRKGVGCEHEQPGEDQMDQARCRFGLQAERDPVQHLDRERAVCLPDLRKRSQPAGLQEEPRGLQVVHQTVVVPGRSKCLQGREQADGPGGDEQAARPDRSRPPGIGQPACMGAELPDRIGACSEGEVPGRAQCQSDPSWPESPQHPQDEHAGTQRTETEAGGEHQAIDPLRARPPHDEV